MKEEYFEDELAKREYFNSELKKRVRVMVIVIVSTFLLGVMFGLNNSYKEMTGDNYSEGVMECGYIFARLFGIPLSLLSFLFGGRKKGIRFKLRIICYVLFIPMVIWLTNEIVRFSVNDRFNHVIAKLREEDSYEAMVEKYSNVEYDYETGSYFRTDPREDEKATENLLQDMRYYDNESGCIYVVDKDSEGKCYSKLVASYYTDGDVFSIPSGLPAKRIQGVGMDADGNIPVKYISENAFTETIKYKKIVVPETVFEISESAFRGCPNLKEIVVGDNVRVIKENAFVDMPDLTIVCNKDSVVYKYAVDNNIKVKLMGED